MTIETISYTEMLKRNVLAIVKEHREKCDKDCNVNLTVILDVAQKAGLKFTDEEKRLFI